MSFHLISILVIDILSAKVQLFGERCKKLVRKIQNTKYKITKKGKMGLELSWMKNKGV